MSEPGRKMFYGSKAPALQRAYYASWASSLTIEVIFVVGDLVSSFFSKDFFEKEVQPLIGKIESLDEEHPLDEQTVLLDADAS